VHKVFCTEGPVRMPMPGALHSILHRAPEYSQVPYTEIPLNIGVQEADPTRQNNQADSVDPAAQHVCHFVETGVFQSLTGLVIVLNMLLMCMEIHDPKLGHYFKWLNHSILIFYIFEVASRACFFRMNFLYGPLHLVLWNLLDLAVVAAGILDEWLLPCLPANHGSSLQLLLFTFRCLRVARVLKIIRITLESDLSWTEGPRFQSFVAAAIVINGMLMGFETDIEWKGWVIIENLLLSIYVFELVCRLKRFGLSFFSCAEPDIMWNLLDFTIVVSSSLDSWLLPLCRLLVHALHPVKGQPGSSTKELSFGQAMMLMRMMRLMRILRLVKLVKSVRPLYILVASVVSAVQGVWWVLVLTLVVLYGMGIVATRLIGHGVLLPHGQDNSIIQSPFATVPESMFTLFRVMSAAASDQESDAINQLVSELPGLKFAFVFFMITSSWMLLSILTAVVSETMISTTGQQEYELQITSDELDRARHLQELQLLFKQLDVKNNGKLDEASLMNFLGDEGNANKCAKSCRVPVRYIKDVFLYLSVEGQEVDKNRFIAYLADVGKPVTEKSVMKLEAHLSEMQRNFDRSMDCMTERCKTIEEAQGLKMWNQILGKIQDHMDMTQERLTTHNASIHRIDERLNQLSDLVFEFHGSFKALSTNLEGKFREAYTKAESGHHSFAPQEPKTETCVKTSHVANIPFGHTTDAKAPSACLQSVEACSEEYSCNKESLVSEMLRSKLDYVVYKVSLELMEDFFNPAALTVSQQQSPSNTTPGMVLKVPSHSDGKWHLQPRVHDTNEPQMSQVKSCGDTTQTMSKARSPAYLGTSCTLRSRSLPPKLHDCTDPSMPRSNFKSSSAR